MRCAIICTGPSVQHQDLSRINVPKIGVNWSYLGTPSDFAHVLSNRVLIDKHGHELESLTPETKHRISALPAQGAFVPKRTLNFANWSAYKAISEIPRLPEQYDIYRDGWVFAGGGPCALQVAVSFGFKEIIFVGLDLWTGKNCHFYEPDGRLSKSAYSGYSRSALDRAWIIQSAYFRLTMVEMLERGVRILNTGLSRMFEHIDFDEVFGA